MNVFPLDFEGQTYQCRPTFKVISAIEQGLGRSIYLVGSQAADQTLQVRELAFVVHQMLVSAGHQVPVDRIGEHLVATGTKEVTVNVMKFCLSAFGGPKLFDEPEATVPLARPAGEPIN